MTDSLLVPPGTRLLHIGPHKTGSTAIQEAMFSARGALAEHGVYYPGGARRRREASEQLRAATRKHATDRPLDAWEALCREVEAAGPMRVCVSDELFGKVPWKVAARIVEDLGGPAAHVLAFARPYDSYLPSQWQERVKAGRVESYTEWLSIVLGDDASSFERRNVWRAHDTPALVRRWTGAVGEDRFTLVVADESDRTQLPRVFEAMLGLPEGMLEVHPDRANRSLGLAEVELMRAVNVVLAGRGEDPVAHRRAVERQVRSLGDDGGLAPGPRRPVMPEWARARVRQLSDARAEAVRALPVRVVGDPEWLRSRTAGADDAVQPAASADVAERLAAAVLAPSAAPPDAGSADPPRRRTGLFRRRRS